MTGLCLALSRTLSLPFFSNVTSCVFVFPLILLVLADPSHQLLALDDEEFYEKQRPLTLEEVRQLAGFLKDWLCRWVLQLGCFSLWLLLF